MRWDEWMINDTFRLDRWNFLGGCICSTDIYNYSQHQVIRAYAQSGSRDIFLRCRFYNTFSFSLWSYFAGSDILLVTIYHPFSFSKTASSFFCMQKLDDISLFPFCIGLYLSKPYVLHLENSIPCPKELYRKNGKCAVIMGSAPVLEWPHSGTWIRGVDQRRKWPLDKPIFHRTNWA